MTDRASYYRERAAEARAKVEAMKDNSARQTMLVAQMREGMAKTAERDPGSNWDPPTR